MSGSDLVIHKEAYNRPKGCKYLTNIWYEEQMQLKYLCSLHHAGLSRLINLLLEINKQTKSVGDLTCRHVLAELFSDYIELNQNINFASEAVNLGSCL